MASSDAMQRSMDFFKNPASYLPFSITKDHKEIFGCGDPREEEDEDLKVIKQIMGGGAGIGVHRALGTYATKKIFIPVETGVAAEAAEISTTDVVTVHGRCAFVEGILPIHYEIEEPSDFTQDSLDAWAHYYQMVDEVRSYKGRVRTAAGRQAEYIQEHGGTDLIFTVVDDAYPDHPNIRQMVGENRAGIYTVNHHPHVGIDRETKHRVERLEVQGYHTNPGAMLEAIQRNRSLTKREKAGRSVAMLFTEAAVRTVIYGKHGGINCIEVFPGEKGLDFVDIAKRPAVKESNELQTN